MKRGGGEGSDGAEFKYPAEVNGKARITITGGDMDRLYPGQYLNDTLVNFALRYMQKEGWPGCKQDALPEKVHVFSSFFYTKFTEGTARTLDEAYGSVKSWTRKVDIFNKKYVFVPVCAGCHWSLVCIANLDKLQTGEGEESEERPCMIFMDSLNHHDFEMISRNLRSYLQKEWAKASRRDICLDSKTLPLVLPNVPMQTNGYDCGVYVIRHFQEICRQWPRCTSGDIKNGLKEYFTWDTFTPGDIDEERGKMMKILGGCKSRYMAEERKREAQEKRQESDKTLVRPGCTADEERRFRAALIGPLPGPLRRRGLLATTSPHPSTFNEGSGSKRARSHINAALGKRKKTDYSYDSSEEVEVVQPTAMPTRGGRGCTGPFSPFSSVTSSQVSASTLGDPNPTAAMSHADTGVFAPIISGQRVPKQRGGRAHGQRNPGFPQLEHACCAGNPQPGRHCYY